EVLAIMLPGCSKTTLLDLLAIVLEGFVAYCIQNDIFFSQLTVKESLSYTARLRLPRELSRRDKLKQVEIRTPKQLKKQQRLHVLVHHISGSRTLEAQVPTGSIANNQSGFDGDVKIQIIIIGLEYELVLIFEEHQNGFGAEWTHKYQPLRIIESEQIDDIYLKLNKTLDYMKKYGIDNVRGSAFSKVNLLTEKQVIYQLLSYILKNIPMSSLLNTAAFWTL
ncbi:13685_t:CDS:2, partial [Rhizophagus irregularis]